jgi:lipopolysaccharide export system protein LptA
LTGTEPVTPRPHLDNEQIIIDATRIDVTLEGPKMKARGAVTSVLKPPQTKDAKAGTKMPSMLKSDQVVYIAADDLDYDGGLSKATYTGRAKLWQAETSVQAATIALDNRSGDLSASKSVTTSTMLEQHETDTKKKERPFDWDGERVLVRGVGAASDLHRRRPLEWPPGRHDGGQDRALSAGVW